MLPSLMIQALYSDVPEGEKNCIILEIEWTCDECNYEASIKGTVRQHKNS